MAVNTLIQDSQDENPLIRALAIRTMTRIRVESVAEHLVIPLKKRLKDPAPYVRKTVALAIAKLYSIIPEAIETADLFTGLVYMLGDDTPMVVSNCTAAILEINRMREEPIFELDATNVPVILSVLPHSTEWCQIQLLDALAKYEPVSPGDAVMMIDRMTQFLRHSNPAVVIGAFRCILLYLEYDERLPQDTLPSILPAFLTLLGSSDPENQFVVLRTLRLFAQKYPRVLAKEIRLFFCAYNEPSYVKREKLAILTANCSPSNAALMINELAEYCNSVDVGFVRKTVAVIGEIALSFPECTEKCVDVLVSLLRGKADYAVEEAVIVLSDILRKFPGRFESIIQTVASHVDRMKASGARAAMIWILGEYSEIIEHIDIVLDPFLDTFTDEPPLVQLQLISAVVKAYLVKPDDIRDELQFVLNEATNGNVLPDVRNRAMMYWRMLSLGEAKAREFVKFSKDMIDVSASQFSDEVLHKLLADAGMVAGVLHVLPSDFLRKTAVARVAGTDATGRVWTPARMIGGKQIVAVYTDWTATELWVQVLNKTEKSITSLALAVNVNGCGIGFAGPPDFPSFLAGGESCDVSIGLQFNSDAANATKSAVELDFALRTSEGICYFQVIVNIKRMLGPLRRMKRAEYLKIWRENPGEVRFTVEGARLAGRDELQERKIFVVAERSNEICLAFVLGEKIYICDVEYREAGLRVIIKGDSALLALLRDGARQLFCSD
jgi:hypothetical protein